MDAHNQPYDSEALRDRRGLKIKKLSGSAGTPQAEALAEIVEAHTGLPRAERGLSLADQRVRDVVAQVYRTRFSTFTLSTRNA